MRCILSGITRLKQHLSTLLNTPKQYIPPQCLNCGCSGLRYHGFYLRKPDRRKGILCSLNPVKIPRFYCLHCKTTCSVLPECISPRRWYLWSIQEEVLKLSLQGMSCQSIAQRCSPSRWTISRWLRRLRERFIEHTSHLRSVFSELGRTTDFESFWPACLKLVDLSAAMVILNNARVIVP